MCGNGEEGETAASGQAGYQHVRGGPELPLGPVSESQVTGLVGTNGSENANSEDSVFGNRPDRTVS